MIQVLKVFLNLAREATCLNYCAHCPLRAWKDRNKLRHFQSQLMFDSRFRICSSRDYQFSTDLMEATLSVSNFRITLKIFKQITGNNEKIETSTMIRHGVAAKKEDDVELPVVKGKLVVYDAMECTKLIERTMIITGFCASQRILRRLSYCCWRATNKRNANWNPVVPLKQSTTTTRNVASKRKRRHCMRVRQERRILPER